jgi:amidase
LCFAAKDNFEIQGHVTGAGNPDWKRTHGAAAETASSVIRLIQCGATLAGKTQMNELAYGALGENQHYGTPFNPRAPDRVPGGSSSGSASAVAGGLVDFALGSDSACSVRLPAALCGVFGFRPTFDRVSTRGLVPLSPSLDTVGWFARDPELLLKVGNVLLDEPRAETGPPQVALWADDAAALVDPAVLEALQPAVDAIGQFLPRVQTTRVVGEGAEFGLEWFWYRVSSVQVREVWATHGAWIEGTRPDSTVLCAENFSVAADSTSAETREAQSHWDELASAVRRLIRPDALMILPTAAGIAPPLRSPADVQRAFTRPTLSLMSIAVVAGLPQVTIPAGVLGGCPVGLSIVGPRGSDEHLLEIARDLGAALRLDSTDR